MCDGDGARMLSALNWHPSTIPRSKNCGNTIIFMLIHLITFALCQALQIPSFYRQTTGSNSSGIYGAVEEPHIRQVNKYRIKNHDDYCGEIRTV